MMHWCNGGHGGVCPSRHWMHPRPPPQVSHIARLYYREATGRTIYDFPCLFDILSHLSAQTPLMTGLASELFEGHPRQPLHQEEMSSSYEGTKILHPLATPSLSVLSPCALFSPAV